MVVKGIFSREINTETDEIILSAMTKVFRTEEIVTPMMKIYPLEKRKRMLNLSDMDPYERFVYDMCMTATGELTSNTIYVALDNKFGLKPTKSVVQMIKRIRNRVNNIRY